MEDQADFTTVLRTFMGRAFRTPTDLARLTGISLDTLGNWIDGKVRRPRVVSDVLKLARALALDAQDTTILLTAARHPPLETLQAQAEQTNNPELMPLVACWPSTPTAAPGRAGIALHRPPTFVPCHQLRPPIADFVGRDAEIDQLVTTLRTALLAGRGAIISGVQGMGGIGKTELAYTVAHHLRDMFPDGQIVLNLRGTSAAPLTSAEALQAVIHTFAPGTQLVEDLDLLQQHYQSVLHGQRVLILADDARDAAQVRALLPPSGCTLLLTSRQRFALPGMQTLQLEQLDEETAVTLLRRLAPRLDVEEARALARLCGYLPLALRVCGSMLDTTPALSVADYLAGLADERHRLDQLRDPDDPQLDVAAALVQSYARLDAPAQAIFRQLGVLIADFTTELAQTVAATPSEVDLRTTLHHLLRRNLVMYDAGRDHWRLHDLVRDLARRELEQIGEWEAVMWRYAHTALRLAQTTQDLYLIGGEAAQEAVARFDAERPHIDAARRWAAFHIGTALGDQLLLDATLATFYIGEFRYHLRHEIIPQCEQALAAARRLGNRQVEGQILGDLGIAYNKSGEARRAIPYFENALAIAQASGDRRGEALVLSNLGFTYALLGDQPRVIPYCQQALAIAQAIGDRRIEGRILSHLGCAYIDLGDPGRSIAYLEAYLAIARALGDSCGEGRALGFLGLAHTDLGNTQGAIPYFEQALTIFRSLGDQRNEGYALHHLGIAELQLGEVKRAIECYHGSHTIAYSIGDRRLEGYALSNLAHAQAREGDIVRAARTIEQAVRFLRDVGDRHGEAECQWRVGLVLAQHGAPAQALPLLRAALAYQQEIGYAKAREHAALYARLERGEELPPQPATSISQRTVGKDQQGARDDDQQL